MHQVAWHIPSVGSSKASKCLSRIRSGGVVVSKTRLVKSATSIVDHPKLRIAGLPNRKAGSLKKR
jgi:hypothetical protein